MTTSGSPRPWRVGIVSKTFFNVPLWSAIANERFKPVGLDVELVMLGNRSQTEPLLQGELDVVLGTPEAALQNCAAGGPLRIVAGNTGKLSHSLITRPPYNTIASLRGGTLGILNMVEGSFFQLKAMLEHHGLHYPGDYKVLETGGVPPRHAALLEGRIDGGLQSIPWNYVAEDAGLNNLGEVVGYIPDWQFVSTNANAERFRADAAPLANFLQVMKEATDWVYANRDAAAAIAEKELPTERAYALRAWDYYTGTEALTRNMDVNARGLEVVLATQKAAGLIPSSAPDHIDAYLSREFFDPTK